MIDGVKNLVKDGSGMIVPSGAKHSVVNTSKVKPLKLYTIYSPPEHQDKVIRKTRQEAFAKEEHYNGKPKEEQIYTFNNFRSLFLNSAEVINISL